MVTAEPRRPCRVRPTQHGADRRARAESRTGSDRSAGIREAPVHSIGVTPILARRVTGSPCAARGDATTPRATKAALSVAAGRIDLRDRRIPEIGAALVRLTITTFIVGSCIERPRARRARGSLQTTRRRQRSSLDVGRILPCVRSRPYRCRDLGASAGPPRPFLILIRYRCPHEPRVEASLEWLRRVGRPRLLLPCSIPKLNGRAVLNGSRAWFFAGVIQLVECQLPKLDVVGSSPIARSVTCEIAVAKKWPPL